MTFVYHFHVNLFAEPREAGFACTWEDAATLLEQLPGMIFEPDGSFVFSGSLAPKERAGPRAPSRSDGRAPSATSTRWHVNGHLFDFAGKLHRVELHGESPRESFDALLRCTGWPAQPLAFELVSEGVTIDEARFRTLAER